jgi:hypothetical protein
MENGIVVIDDHDWYERLIEDCHAIVIEKFTTASLEVIECWHMVGERICNDSNYKKFKKGDGFVKQIAHDMKKSQSTIYFAIAFYEKYPDLKGALDIFSEGKSINWFHIINKYLPKPKSLTDTMNTTNEPKAKIDFTPYHDLFDGVMAAYNHYSIRPPWLQHMGEALQQMEREPFEGCEGFINGLKELVSTLDSMLYGR